MSEATKHHAETRDPPSQDPRDHMAQAVRHNSSHIVTSKQTTTKPCRNESGEKKGETDSESASVTEWQDSGAIWTKKGRLLCQLF